MASIIVTARRILGVTFVAAIAGGYAGKDGIASIRSNTAATAKSAASSSVAPSDPDAPVTEATSFGRISGDCTPLGRLDGEAAVERVIAIEFPGQVRVDDLDRLTPSALTLFTEMETGSDAYGQAVSFDALARCVQARLLKTRSMLQVRNSGGPRPDYLANVAGRRVGVTVARAHGFPSSEADAARTARALLDAQLERMRASAANTRGRDRWRRPALFVLSDSTHSAASIVQAWDELPVSVRAETMLWLAVTRGDHGFVYGEPIAL